MSDALLSQVDLLASLAELLGQQPYNDAKDSQPLSNTLLGEDQHGRDHLIEHAGTLAIRQGHWKYIVPSNGRSYNKLTDTELGNAPTPQLYDLSKDIREQNNVAETHPEIVQELADLLENIKTK